MHGFYEICLERVVLCFDLTLIYQSVALYNFDPNKSSEREADIRLLKLIRVGAESSTEANSTRTADN